MGNDFTIGKYLKIKSKILDEERTIVIHLPDGYDKGQHSYPVLYVLDADWEDLFTSVVATSGYLNEFSRIPKVIVVGICNTDRPRDMLPIKIEREPTSGGASNFRRFISEELKPFVEKNYRTEPFFILYGGSYAGLFTVSAFLEKPEAFKAYIASSPGIGVIPDYFFTKAKNLFKQNSSLPHYMYLVYGEHDYSQTLSHTPDFFSFLESNSPGDFQCQMEMIENEGHVPFIGLFKGLRFVFSEWAFPEDRRAEAGLDEIKQPIRKEKIPEAIEALLLACEFHPYSPDAFYYLGEAYEKKGQIDLALKNYKKAWEVDPDYLMAVQKIQSLEKKNR
jgi:predicted alpha/beta superfamily hydrolase